jgi:hypothetical protein
MHGIPGDLSPHVAHVTYSLAPWVEVLHSAITVSASALWIAAVGYAIGTILSGLGNIIVAFRRRP